MFTASFTYDLKLCFPKEEGLCISLPFRIFNDKIVVESKSKNIFCHSVMDLGCPKPGPSMSYYLLVSVAFYKSVHVSGLSPPHFQGINSLTYFSHIIG